MILLVACSYLHVELCSFIIVVDLGEKSNKAEGFFFFLEVKWILTFLFLEAKVILKLKYFLFVYVPGMNHTVSSKHFMPLLPSSSHFWLQVLSISPLETHFATVLLFIMAAILYSIAYMEIKLQPQGAEYLLLFRFICLVSGIIAVELPISIIISPFWLFMVNFLPILIVGVLCSYKQIYQFLYYTANLIFNAVPSLLKKIYQLVCQIYDWLLQICQSAAFQAFFSGEREDDDNQGVEIV